VAGHLMAVAALCCCIKIKNGQFQDRNRPLTWGGAKGSRTPDLLHAMQALYQLSYSPLAVDRAVWRGTGASIPVRGSPFAPIRHPAGRAAGKHPGARAPASQS
jgi:hypothetical protein